ncbi:MAG: polysaccharide biosynthesis tyrosine autokinase, partial [Caldilineaceae bacterium]|nr:polysaccharide biosynthesis tyrosine autokinase [Caldilineaceae bacterium]
VYESRTTLVVGSATTNPNPTSNEIFLAQQLAQTYAGLAERDPIKNATLEALNAEWLPYYTVQSQQNSPIIEIAVIDQDPVFARDVAATLAQQLILQGPAGRSEQKREEFVDSQLARLEISIVETQDEIAQKQQELANVFSAREIANIENQIDALENKLYTSQSNYAALLANTQKGAANALSILESAAIPLEPVSSQLLLNMLVAAFVGMVLAGGGAYLIDFLDDSIKDGEDAQQLLGVPTLASVPELAAEHEHEKLVMLYTTPHPAAEAYRMLRTNLQFASVDQPIQMLLVTSPAPEDGKSLTAANLAAAYTRAGKRVILVDADLHRPSQQRFFQLRNNWGLTLGLFDSDMMLEALFQETTIPGLRVMTTGPLPPNPAELLGSRRMQDILAQLRNEAEIIIIDSPPISAVSDALILTSQADAVLLVVKSGKTSRALARKAMNTLRQVKAQVIGTVYNGVHEYDSDYTYDYTYTYYDTEPVEETVPVHANGHTNGTGTRYVNGNGQQNGNGYANGYGETNGHHSQHENPDDEFGDDDLVDDTYFEDGEAEGDYATAAYPEEHLNAAVAGAEMERQPANHSDSRMARYW